MWGDWHSGWMGLGGLVFWGLVIAAIVFALRGHRCGHRHGADKSALDILKERYARGEIGDEEFRQKRKELE